MTSRLPRPRLRRLAAAVALAATAATLCACGSEDASAGSEGDTVIKLVDPGNAGLLA